LYIPVRDWLRSRGYAVHVEQFDGDVIAVKDGLLVAVELKLCLEQGLIRQLQQRAMWADRVYAAIASTPRTVADIKYGGFGLLMVNVDAGTLRERIKPKPQPWFFHKRRLYRLKKLTGRPEAMDHEMAGLPACKALRDQRESRIMLMPGRGSK
jgi:hypothetical protein